VRILVIIKWARDLHIIFTREVRQMQCLCTIEVIYIFVFATTD